MSIVFCICYFPLSFQKYTYTHTPQTISMITTGEADGLGVEVVAMVQKGLQRRMPFKKKVHITFKIEKENKFIKILTSETFFTILIFLKLHNQHWQKKKLRGCYLYILLLSHISV